MSLIKLLISRESGEGALNGSDSRLCHIEMHYVEWGSLMRTAEIDFDVALLEDTAIQDNPELIQYLRAIAPACKIMVDIRHSSSQSVAYLRMGVTGLLDSIHEPNRLAEIIHRVYQGEYYLDPHIAQLLAMRQIKKMLEPFVSLSSREFDVFCLLAEGCNLQTIASQLGISNKTVSNCQTQIKLKLGLDNRQTIKKLAKTHGLIIEKGL